MSKFPFSRILFFSLIISCYLPILAQDKTEAQLLYEKGFQLSKNQNFDEALKVLRQALKLSPENADIYNALGAVLIGQKKFNDAAENFRKALQILSLTQKDSSTVHRNLCIALVFDKKLVDAIAECQKAVDLDEASVVNFLQLAQAKRTNNQIDDGIKVAESALIKFPEDEHLLVFLGSSYAMKSDFASELDILVKLVKTKPQVSAYQVMLSEAYLRFDRVEEAAETARKAIELDALNPFAYYRLARVYDEIGMSEEAIAALQKAVELKPNEGAIYYWYGKNLGKVGRTNEAVLTLREAVRLMPDDMAAHYQLGQQLIEDQRFADAVEPLRRANKLNSNDLDVKLAFGLASMESGNYDEASVILSEADRLRPSDSNIQMLIRVTKERKQGVAEIEHIRQRVAAYPNDYKAKKYLGRMYQYSGKTAEAEKFFLEAFKLEPESGESNNYMAIFYHETRRYDIAIKYLRRAVEIKQHHVLYVSLASYLEKLGRTQEALNAYQKAFEIKPDSPYVLKLYADALVEAGKRSEAVEMYKKLLQVDPRNAPALFKLSILSLKLLDKESAKLYYEALRPVDPILARNLTRIFRLI